MTSNQIRITASCTRLVVYSVKRRNSHVLDFSTIVACLAALNRLRVSLRADYVDVATGYRVPAEVRS